MVLCLWLIYSISLSYTTSTQTHAHKQNLGPWWSTESNLIVAPFYLLHPHGHPRFCIHPSLHVLIPYLNIYLYLYIYFYVYCQQDHPSSGTHVKVEGENFFHKAVFSPPYLCHDTPTCHVHIYNNNNKNIYTYIVLLCTVLQNIFF